MSSLTLSNDLHEGKIVRETFKRIMDGEGVDPESSIQILKFLEGFEKFIDGLGFCLSGDGDLLSQWRGYATDGQGFSIGLSKAYLEALSERRDSVKSGFRLHQVIYDKQLQEIAVMPAFNHIRTEVQSGALKLPRPPNLLESFGDPAADEKYEQSKVDYKEAIGKLFSRLFLMLPNFFSLKNSAFKEEQEWRLVSLLGKGTRDECLFRASGNRLIPYRECTLEELAIPAITDVVIGPRNETPEFVVEELLAQNGFNNVAVRRSNATYR